MNNPSSTLPTTSRSRWGRHLWLAIGGLALTAAGVAAGLAWRPAPQQAELLAPPGSVAATKASLDSNEAVVEPGASGNAQHAKEGSPVPAAARTASHSAPHQAPHRVASASTNAAPSVGSATTPLATQPAVVCATCGIIEGVREVQQKGQGSGLGAVAGGVVGGAVGNQMGHGNGRALMTVLGAIGGGLAGNEIEKRTKTETVYEVRVRMDDGSVRTFQQKSAPTPGSHVTVDGNTLHTTRAGSTGGDAQMMRTSTGT